MIKRGGSGNGGSAGGRFAAFGLQLEMLDDGVVGRMDSRSFMKQRELRQLYS